MTEREKELKALTQCADALGNLGRESIIRVFQMLSIHFEILPILNSQVKKEESNNYSTEKLIELSQHKLSEESNNFSATDYPSLKDLTIKNYPKNEAEWILCYSFYASNQGTGYFTLENVRDNYKEGKRFTENNRKNFSTNINKCITHDWLST